MEDFGYSIGTMPFTTSCSMKAGKFSFGMLVETARGKWVHVFGKAQIESDPAVILSSLTSLWPKIAGPYAGKSSDRFAIDLSLLVGGTPTGKVEYVRDGLEIVFNSADGVNEQGSESVIPVEVLLATGNLLTTLAPPHLAALWERVSVSTDLPAFPILDMEMNQSDEDARRENEWYAKSLGQSLDEYERAANWLYARQLAFAVGHPDYPTEPTREEYECRSVPANLPTMDEINAIYALSKDKLGMTLDRLHDDAVGHRNFETRSITVFRRWFPKSASQILA